MTQSLDQLLDGDRVAKLKPLAITDVADLVGVLESDHASIGRVLDLDDAAVDQLHARALDALTPEVRKAFTESRDNPPAMGARNPADP